MTTPLWSLLAFASWSMVLVIAVGTARVVQVLAGTKSSNSFPSGTQHGGDRYWRLNRAHMNSVENLPIFGAIVVTGHFAAITHGAFATAAVAVVCARVVQSLAHIASNANAAVNLRFTAYCVQLGACGYMIATIVASRA